MLDGGDRGPACRSTIHVEVPDRILCLPGEIELPLKLVLLGFVYISTLITGAIAHPYNEI